jgi:hypothetical protein
MNLENISLEDSKEPEKDLHLLNQLPKNFATPHTVKGKASTDKEGIMRIEVYENVILNIPSKSKVSFYESLVSYLEFNFKNQDYLIQFY